MTTDRTDLAFGGACNYLAVAFKPQAAGSGSLHLKLFHGQETTSFLQFSPPIRRNETRIKIHTGGWARGGGKGGAGTGAVFVFWFVRVIIDRMIIMMKKTRD